MAVLVLELDLLSSREVLAEEVARAGLQGLAILHHGFDRQRHRRREVGPVAAGFGVEIRELVELVVGGRPPVRALGERLEERLGALADGKGLKTTYKAMIKAAFKPEWWDSDTQVGGFSVMENNFSLYWGLSVMLYESKLVSDDRPQ